MTENNKQSRGGNTPKPQPDSPRVIRDAKAFEKDRLHPALQINQPYPAIKPDRRWSTAKDDATAPTRPPSIGIMTDLDPDMEQRREINRQESFRRKLSLFMGFVSIVGLVILLLLVTKSV